MLSCSQILVVFTVVSFNRIANYCHYTKNISEKIKMGRDGGPPAITSGSITAFVYIS